MNEATNKEFIKNIEKNILLKNLLSLCSFWGPDSMSLLFLVNAFIKYKKGIDGFNRRSSY